MLVSYNSGYLLRRNWIQTCLMADQGQEKVDRLLRELARCLEPSWKQKREAPPRSFP